jgi:hypothetical protein
MGNYLSSLLSRHIETGEKVLPRLAGSFEQVKSFPEAGITEITDTSGSLLGDEHEAISPLSRKVGYHEPKPVFLHSEEPQQNRFQPENRSNPYPVASSDPASFTSQPEPPWLPAPKGLEAGFSLPDYNIQMPPKSDVRKEDYSLNEFQEGEEKRVISFENTRIQEAKEIAPLQSSFSSDHEQPAKSTQSMELRTEGRKPIAYTFGILGEPPGLRAEPNAGNSVLPDRNAASKPAPVIKVSIGQINVRAVTSPSPVSAPKNRDVPKPLLSLEDYLKGRG